MASAIIKTGDSPGAFYVLDFPLELNNSDYLRRILCNLTFALRPLYKAALRKQIPWQQDALGQEIAPESIDAYDALKHVSDNVAHYARALGQSADFLLSAVKHLLGARSKLLVHEALGGVDRPFILESFKFAHRLTASSHVVFAQENLDRLQKQFEDHRNSKEERKKKAPRGDRGLSIADINSHDREPEREAALPGYRPKVEVLLELVASYRARNQAQMCRDLQVAMRCLVDHADSLSHLIQSIAKTREEYEIEYAKDQLDTAKKLEQKIQELEAQLQDFRASSTRGYLHLRTEGRAAKKDGVESILQRLLAKLLRDGFEATTFEEAGFTRDLVALRWGPSRTGDSQPSSPPHGRVKGSKARAAPSSGTDTWELRHLLDAGFTVQQLKLAGMGVPPLKAAAFSAQELRAEGYSLPELNCGFTIAELKAAGVSAAEFVAARYHAQSLRDAGFTAQDFKAEDFRAAGVTEQLQVVGFTAAELRLAGFTAPELQRSGFQASKLKIAGFSTEEVHPIGISAKQLLAEGHSGKDLRDAGFSALELKEANAQFSDASTLKALGFSAAEVGEAGFSALALLKARYTYPELALAGITGKQLKEEGCQLRDLKAVGFNAKQLREAGYTAQEIYAVGFGSIDLSLAGIEGPQFR